MRQEPFTRVHSSAHCRYTFQIRMKTVLVTQFRQQVDYYSLTNYLYELYCKWKVERDT